MLVKQLAHDAIMSIDKELRDNQKYALLDKLDYVKDYVLALERENYGLKSTVNNQKRSLEKLKGYW